jgi:hypothetical protein
MLNELNELLERTAQLGSRNYYNSSYLRLNSELTKIDYKLIIKLKI